MTEPQFKMGERVKIRAIAGVPIVWRNRFGVVKNVYKDTRKYDVWIGKMQGGGRFLSCAEAYLVTRDRGGNVEPANERTARTMAGVSYDVHYDADKVKISDPEIYAALEFLREYADDDTDFDILLRVRNGKLVYMGDPEGAQPQARLHGHTRRSES